MLWGAVTIARLAACPQAVPALSALYQQVWPEWYGPDGPGDAQADLRERSRWQGMPLGLVALANDRPVGAAGLAALSFGAMAAEGPWLIGLTVAPGFRRQGIGARLIAGIEDAARGPSQWLYCTTKDASGLLLRRGWIDLRRAGEGPDRVYRLTL